MPAFLQRWLAAAARPAVVQPLSEPVAADDAAYRDRKGAATLAVRNARRWLQFVASGQASALRERIDPRWKSCLWIHAEAPQVGDALMDLAPRSLLREHGIEVDLLAAPHLVALFEGDRWFRRCVAEPGDVDPARCDFAIVSSHARRALQPKAGRLRTLPWISLAGFYSVPDYHRGAFVTRRLADCLGVDLERDAMRRHARQKLAPAHDALGAELPFAAASRPRVALALGGVHADRSYRHWPAVLAALHAAGVRSFALVGSANGRRAAEDVARAAPSGIHLHPCVDRTDLVGTRAVIAACDLVVCADGGLMHLAFTTSTPVLALFTCAIDPAWRLPLGAEGGVLRSATRDVSDIAPAEVAAAALRRLADADRDEPFEDAIGDDRGGQRGE